MLVAMRDVLARYWVVAHMALLAAFLAWVHGGTRVDHLAAVPWLSLAVLEMTLLLPPTRKNETFDEQLGEAARKAVGNQKWRQRVALAIERMRALMYFDHLYIGGGNSTRVDPSLLPVDVTIVSNTAGILGGIKLWDDDHIAVHPGAG